MSFSYANHEYLWKKRVLTCPKQHFQEQERLLAKNPELTQELKLQLVSSKNKEIELIGLDGRVKNVFKAPVKLKELEEIINSMPMRKAELEKKERVVNKHHF